MRAAAERSEALCHMSCCCWAVGHASPLQEGSGRAVWEMLFDFKRVPVTAVVGLLMVAQRQWTRPKRSRPGKDRHSRSACIRVTVHVNVDIRLNQASLTVCVPNGTSD